MIHIESTFFVVVVVIVTGYFEVWIPSLRSAPDFVLQQFTGQSVRCGLLVVKVDRKQSQTSWQRRSSEERLYCCNTGSRAFKNQCKSVLVLLEQTDNV